MSLGIHTSSHLFFQCPIDTRRELSENIVVVGGTAMTPGFYHRLKRELDALVAKPRYKEALGVKTFKFPKAPARENYTAWLGGEWHWPSLSCTTENKKLVTHVESHVSAMSLLESGE